MDKLEKELMELAATAKQAVQELKLIQKEYMGQLWTYDEMQEMGKPLVEEYNRYAKALAKARKMPYKPISLGYFLR